MTRCEQLSALIAATRRHTGDARPATCDSKSGSHHGDQTLSHLPQSTAPSRRLTSREAEVLRLIAHGQSNREIADALFLSTRTVERHIANIYLKIDVHSKADATAYAWRHHWA